MTKFKVGDKVRIVDFGYDDTYGGWGIGFPLSVTKFEGIIELIDDESEDEGILVKGPDIKFNTAWGENTVWGSSEHLELVK